MVGVRVQKGMSVTAKETDRQAVLTSEPGGAETLTENRLDSDEVWVEMLRQSYITQSRNRILGGAQRDLRHQEVGAADRKAFRAALKASYARRKDTLLWASVVLLLSAILLMPVAGVEFGLLLAFMTTALWTAVHQVRRL